MPVTRGSHRLNARAQKTPPPCRFRRLHQAFSVVSQAALRAVRSSSTSGRIIHLRENIVTPKSREIYGANSETTSTRFTKNLMGPCAAAVDCEVFGVAARADVGLSFLRLRHQCIDPVVAGVVERRFPGFEAQPDLRLGVAGGRPAHQGVDLPCRIGRKLQNPVPGPRLTRRHGRSGWLIDARTHGNHLAKLFSLLIANFRAQGKPPTRAALDALNKLDQTTSV